jgi:uncharacterized membrane protein
MSHGARVIVERAFQSLCHQQADRSFAIAGTPFAVCQRCFGIYAGISLGLLGFPALRSLGWTLSRHAVAIVLVSIIPLTLDWGLAVAGVLDNTPVSRALTGLVAGIAGGLFLGSAFTARRSDSSKFELLTTTFS